MTTTKENAASRVNERKNQRQATRRDAPVVCPTCGRRAERQMRGQCYCSARCRERGRKRSRKAFFGYGYQSARDHPQIDKQKQCAAKVKKEVEPLRKHAAKYPRGRFVAMARHAAD
jgi:hypothetical protein